MLTFARNPIRTAAVRAVNQPEKYYPPKELAHHLCIGHGLAISTEYVYAIKRESQRVGDGLFVMGRAKPTEVIAWLRRHPGFTKRSQLVAA